MRYKIAVTTSDGTMIDQHFRQCTEFSILEMDKSTGEWAFLEKRRPAGPPAEGPHNEAYLLAVAQMLSDCAFLLTHRIGNFPSRIFQAQGITVLEAPASISGSMKKLYRYYKLNH